MYSQTLNPKPQICQFQSNRGQCFHDRACSQEPFLVKFINNSQSLLGSQGYTLSLACMILQQCHKGKKASIPYDNSFTEV